MVVLVPSYLNVNSTIHDDARSTQNISISTRRGAHLSNGVWSETSARCRRLCCGFRSFPVVVVEWTLSNGYDGVRFYGFRIKLILIHVCVTNESIFAVGNSLDTIWLSSVEEEEKYVKYRLWFETSFRCFFGGGGWWRVQKVKSRVSSERRAKNLLLYLFKRQKEMRERKMRLPTRQCSES